MSATTNEFSHGEIKRPSENHNTVRESSNMGLSPKGARAASPSPVAGCESVEVASKKRKAGSAPNKKSARKKSQKKRPTPDPSDVVDDNVAGEPVAPEVGADGAPAGEGEGGAPPEVATPEPGSTVMAAPARTVIKGGAIKGHLNKLTRQLEDQTSALKRILDISTETGNNVKKIDKKIDEKLPAPVKKKLRMEFLKGAIENDQIPDSGLTATEFMNSTSPDIMKFVKSFGDHVVGEPNKKTRSAMANYLKRLAGKGGGVLRFADEDHTKYAPAIDPKDVDPPAPPPFRKLDVGGKADPRTGLFVLQENKKGHLVKIKPLNVLEHNKMVVCPSCGYLLYGMQYDLLCPDCTTPKLYESPEASEEAAAEDVASSSASASG